MKPRALNHVKMLARGGLDLMDRLATAIQLRIGVEQTGLITLLFHHVFEDEREIDRDIVHPQERITYAKYREIIEYFLEAGYTFVTPNNLAAGMTSDQKLIMLTFDDGYQNNLRILPLLRQYQVPATIFLATHYIVNQRAYWWDVVHRHRVSEGAAEAAIRAEQEPLMYMEKESIESYLRQHFGQHALDPVSELDCPLTSLDIKALADEPLVCFGNHTSTHANLAALSGERIAEQLEDSQADLVSLTGDAPQILSYPYGAHSQEAIRVAREIGFQIAITCIPIKVHGPLQVGSPRALQVGRNKVFGDRPLAPQLAAARSDVSVRRALQRRRIRGAF